MGCTMITWRLPSTVWGVKQCLVLPPFPRAPKLFKGSGPLRIIWGRMGRRAMGLGTKMTSLLLPQIKNIDIKECSIWRVTSTYYSYMWVLVYLFMGSILILLLGQNSIFSDLRGISLRRRKAEEKMGWEEKGGKAALQKDFCFMSHQLGRLSLPHKRQLKFQTALLTAK